MYIRKADAKTFIIPGGTQGFMYPSSPQGDQTIALVEFDGVYPLEGYSVNDISTETVYVVEGMFRLEAAKEVYELNPGDLYMVFPRTRYRIEGKGKVLVCITPAWEKNTNRIVK